MEVKTDRSDVTWKNYPCNPRLRSRGRGAWQRFFQYFGPLQFNHLCPTQTNCWTPEHIYLGTQHQNIQDAIEAGTHRSARMTFDDLAAVGRGNKGKLKSEAHKQAMRKPKSEETKARMRKPKSPQHAANISAGLKRLHAEKVEVKLP
jgi:hypothetical protein